MTIPKRPLWAAFDQSKQTGRIRQAGRPVWNGWPKVILGLLLSIFMMGRPWTDPTSSSLKIPNQECFEYII